MMFSLLQCRFGLDCASITILCWQPSHVFRQSPFLLVKLGHRVRGFFTLIWGPSLSGFKIDPAVLEQIRFKFIGYVGGKGRQRLLQDLRKHLGKKTGGEAGK